MRGARPPTVFSCEMIPDANLQLFAPLLTSPDETQAKPTQPDETQRAPLDVREVLRLPMRLWAGMPLASALLCRFVAEPIAHVLVRSSNAAPTLQDAASASVFTGPEIAQLVLAAEHDRVWPAQLRGWCAEKAVEPMWRLTPLGALDGVRDDVRPRNWTVRQVMRRIGLELVEVWT